MIPFIWGEKVPKLFLVFILWGYYKNIQAQELRVVFNHVPPLAIKNDTGLAMDYLNSIVKYAGRDDIRFRLEYMPLARLLKSFEGGNVDISPVSGFWAAEFEGSLSEKPYIVFYPGMVVSNSDFSAEDIEKPLELDNLEICTKKGMPLSSSMKVLLKKSRVNITFITGDFPLERCIQLVQKQRKFNAVYSAYYDEIVFMSKNLKSDVKLVKFKDPGLDIYFAFSKKAENIKTIFNKYHGTEKFKGVYQKLSEKYKQVENTYYQNRY